MEQASSQVAGIDGCRGGWVVATVDASLGLVELAVVAAVAPLVGAVGDGNLAALAIDMPIGLAEDGSRRADRDARALLGPRRSSLFPTPPRAVLDATDYADALARCRAATGKGMSRQAFNLLPKIRELAAALDPTLQPRVSEVHPETSFAVLRGAPCSWPKRTPAGVAERADALRTAFPATDLDALLARPPQGAAVDDVLDAMVAAWTAQRMATGRALVLGDEEARDAAGYRLTITA